MFQAAKGFKKEDLVYVAEEIGAELPQKVTIADLKDIILKSKQYTDDPQFVTDILLSTISDRKKQEEDNLRKFEFEEKIKQQEFAEREKIRQHELDLLRIQGKRTTVGESRINDVPSSKNKFDLPKLEFRRFSGDIKEWLAFWSQFQHIHDDNDIAPENKFQYLIQATVSGSRAREVVDSFPPTGTNYSKVIESLKARFGREDLLVEVYVRELLKLVISVHKNEKLSMTSLYDKVESHMRALDSLGVTTDKCASILYPMVESCFNEDFLKAWNRHPSSSSSADAKERLNNLMQFIKTEVEGEERINLAMSGFGLNEPRSKLPPNKKQWNKAPTAANLLTTPVKDNKKSCIFCMGKHASADCFSAQKMSLEERKSVVREKQCCFSCLTPGHTARKCRAFLKCILCGRKHVPLMCEANQSKKNDVKKTEETEVNNGVNMSNVSGSPKVFLQTLKCKLISDKKEILVRVILDTGSSKSYVVKSLAEEMGYDPVKKETLVHSLFGGVKSEESKHTCYRIRLKSIKNNFACNFEALDQVTICSDVLPVCPGPWLKELQEMDITLSDVGAVSHPVDVLIGADIFGKIMTGQRRVLSSGLVAIETLLGWTLLGKVPDNEVTSANAMMVTSLLVKDMDISDMWRLDSIGIRDPIEQRSKEETKQAVLLHFQETVHVREDGRYEVSMPWKFDHAPLPDNYEMAKKRLDSTCKKLEKDGLRKQYHQVLEDWKKEGIIEDVPDAELTNPGHYLPHLPVVKEQSTTPLRICFDASAKTVNAPSLNDCLEIGVNLIEKIPSILARFRLYKIGVVSDIRKAFLQISLQNKERDFLRFLWYDEERKLKVLRHARVVFGVCSSPFLLGAVIDHHLNKEALAAQDNSFTKSAIEKLKDSFYVDNCVTSINHESNLEPFIKESTEIMKRGKFDLRGWENTSLDNSRAMDPIKLNVLGLVWNKQTDTLELSSEGLHFDEDEKVTKRKILSLLNKIYDPVGYTTPVLLQPKILLQSVWKDKAPWDAEVNEEIKKKFLKWTKELPYLVNIRIPRWIGASSDTTISLHIFCDASQIAYAAVVFARCESSDGVAVQLLQAKSRISPLKNITIPRMELLSATIAARLFDSVKNSLKLNKAQSFFWTDSSTVLTWIKRQEQWSVFVNNRITEIRKLTSSEDWFHIPGDQNPADLPSRGCGAKRLAETRFWEGPDWLKLPQEYWPKSSVNPDEGAVESETRRTVVSASNTEIESVIGLLLKRISSLTKIIRVIAWIMRFRPTAIRRGPKLRSRSIPNLTSEEYTRARNILFRCVQNESFKDEAEKKSLRNLNAYRDEDGILRMRTRLTDEDETKEFLSPVILPSKHLAVKRLIEQQHLLHKHAGTLTLLTVLRNEFWIVKGRRTVKSVIENCKFCRRYQAQSLRVPFPPLPKDRTSLSHVFQVTGVDLAGPLIGRTGEKHWIVIFTCALYRAVHLELIPSLSTPAFILALRRFIARRGRISIVYSDNGTNFVGLHTALRKLNWSKIQKEFEVQQIKWKFNPPSAPWWGGFWERLIRILKDLLRKNLGRASLDPDEISTLVVECESIMNGRPLTYVSDEPEIRTLTPGMFLQSLPGNEMPELDSVDKKSLVKRWRYIQRLREDLKQRFKKEYLGFLRSSHGGRTDTIQVGDIVLVGSDDKKRLVWPLAMVKELYPGRDNIRRLVKVKTSKGTLLRPIQRLYPLEVRGEDRQTVHNMLNCLNLLF